MYGNRQDRKPGGIQGSGNGISIIAFKFFVTADQQMMIFPIMTVLLVGTCLVLLKMSKKIDAIV